MKGRKADVPHTVPLLPRHAAEIAARVGRATAAGLPHIFYVEEKAARGRVVLRALSYGGLEARLSSAAARAAIAPGRRIHGARHHAGTAMLAATGNLKTTQRLLGHADIKSTMRYVHALEADLRAGLETIEAADQSQNSPEPDRQTADGAA